MSKKDYGTSTPIRISRELDSQASEASKRLKMSKQDVMRLAMAIGFEDLKSIDYKVAQAILAAANLAKQGAPK